jgi:phage gp36-like protein
VLPPLYKAHKFLQTRGDLDYTALWILHAAAPLARMEILGRRLLADREVIPQAMQLNPELFKIVYTDILNTKKTQKAVEKALATIDGYLAERAERLFAPVLEYLREIGEARSCTEIEDYFKRNFSIDGVTTVCEYLADQGLIGKVATPIQITKRSNIVMQELAFVHMGEAPDEF